MYSRVPNGWQVLNKENSLKSNKNIWLNKSVDKKFSEKLINEYVGLNKSILRGELLSIFIEIIKATKKVWLWLNEYKVHYKKTLIHFL